MTRGKRTATFMGICGLILVVICIVRFHDPLYEQFLIYRLSSGSHGARIDAAGKLGEMKILKAVPRIIDLIHGDDQERLEFKLESPRWVRFHTPLLYSLHQMGPGAKNQIEAVIEEENKRLGKNALDLKEVSPDWFHFNSSTPFSALIIHPQDRCQGSLIYLREVILS